MMLRFLDEAGIPFVVLATKADKLNATNRKQNLDALAESLGQIPVIPFSSQTGEGAETVWKLIQSAVEQA